MVDGPGSPPPQAQHDLVVEIIGCRDLRKADACMSSDPYCVMEVMGKPSTRCQTKVIQKNLNPKWKEQFQISCVDIGDVLEFSVWDRDEDNESDDLLGRLNLRSEEFLPNGFHGELQLHDTKSYTSFLTLKVFRTRAMLSSKRSPLFLLPRGPCRPQLRPVLSDPALRGEFLGLGAERASRGVDREIPCDPPSRNASLEDLFRIIDKHGIDKREETRRKRGTKKGLEVTQRAYEALLDSATMGKQRPDWTYCDPSDFFEKPQLIDTGESLNCTHNPLISGIYTAPGWKPPHSESNLKCGWSCHTRNLHNEKLGYFNAKDRSRMSPSEQLFHDRLTRQLTTITALTKEDTLKRTTGSVRKQQIAEEQSCLRRKSKGWFEQRVSTHTYFCSPDPYKSGEHPKDMLLKPYIHQAERARSPEREFISGDGASKSHRRPPRAGVLAGTQNRRVAAQALLRPRHCPVPNGTPGVV